MSAAPQGGRAPVWFVLLLVVLSLPLFSFIYFIGATEEGTTARALAWMYPIYVVMSAVCAYICYPDRRELSWILVVLLGARDAGMWLLV